MEIRKENKFKNFFKRYGAIALAGVFTVAIALTIALTVTDKGSEVSTTNLDFQVPMNNAEILKDYSDTDLQFNEVLNRWEIHLGIDFTSQDTAVFSVLDGTVTSVSNNSLEGNVVEITHSNGFVSVYSSLADELLVSEGDTVQKGTQIVNALNILYACKGRVIVTGMGKSGLIGQKIAATLSSTGTPSYFLHPADSTHGDSGVLTRDDVVIAISNSGETSELLHLLPIVKRLGIKLVGMTGKMDSTLSHLSDAVLDISVEKEACPLGKAPTASTTATLAMGDALAVCLLQKRGFTKEDFLFFHPSGALGRGFLYTVEEVMIARENLPLVREDELFKNTLEEISAKKLGSAIVVDKDGKTAGILTDGDIRRAVLHYKDMDNLVVSEAMTRNPKTIKVNALAAQALHLMEANSITSLVVNDEQMHPIGMVHIHDLLKMGVA